MKSSARKKSYRHKADQVALPRKKQTEVVVLFGNSENPTLKESARIITNAGRGVEYKDLSTQIIGQ